ncbi:hypothetical protein RvY_11422 [Ramazzottius varieornatus]|uniref:Uncharacterized protein n=1 Tax=Ramazzottius varieornatus TaxID=947166 RepID=A0A1D1VIG4_RAMVA|nr:hypothetical protein RvY_11422 [Ramazzottius varieornatus]
MSRLNDLSDSRSLFHYPREKPRMTSPNKKFNAAYSSASSVLFPKKTASATWKLPPVTSRKRNHSPDHSHVHSSSSKHACTCHTSDDEEDDHRQPVKSKSHLSSKSNLVLARAGSSNSAPHRSPTKPKPQPIPLAQTSTKITALKGSTSTTSTNSGYSSGSSRSVDDKPSSSKSTVIPPPPPPPPQPVVAAGSSTQLPKRSNKSQKVKEVPSDNGFPLPPRSPATYRRINRIQLKAKLVKELHVEPNLVDVVLSSILDTPPGVSFDDVVGQEQAVRLLRERVVYPALNPNVGDSEKLIKIMFACAKHIQPCIIFIGK